MILAAALLAEPEASRGGVPGVEAALPESPSPADSAGVLSPPADNAAALAPPPGAGTDNDAAVPISPGGGTGELPPTAEGTEMREPSFAAESPPPPRVADPIEPVNRGMFYVNDKLYRWVLKPVAKGYTFVVPEGARVAVRNFFFNLATPIRAVNALLQGKVAATGTELARFALNSTVGFAGFFDAAKGWNLDRKDEDTGQTLGVWGIGNGFYLVLPLLGPSTARDTVGIVGDAFLDPTAYLLRPRDAIYARIIRSENDLSFRLNEYEELTGAAVDPYVAVRDAYIQYRAKRVEE
jgi:phospholipid-binding lipoprotein MlaA